MPGRWTQYDEDEYRLPEGMKRVAYDADTGRYYFRDSDGVLYKGPEGSQFGHMTPVDDVPAGIMLEDDDLEATPIGRSDGYRPLATGDGGIPPISNTNAYRTLLPFFLVIAVTLLLVWRLLPSRPPPIAVTCPGETSPYLVKAGDSCWELSRVHGCSLEKFKELNPKVDCEPLLPGKWVCLPATT